MHIGFDLDKVFIDYPPCVPAGIIDTLYKKKENNHLVYRIPSRMEQWFRLFTHLEIFRPLIADNVSFIRTLSKNKKHSYFLISSRFQFLQKHTDYLMKKYGFTSLFKVLSFNYENKQPHLFKDEKIKQYHIDIYVDDDLDLLTYLAKQNPKVTFFWLTSHTSGKVKANLFAINHLSDILPR